MMRRINALVIIAFRLAGIVAGFAPHTILNLRRFQPLRSGDSDGPIYYNDFEDFEAEAEGDDDVVPPESLGDWRQFRRALSQQGVRTTSDDPQEEQTRSTSSSPSISVAQENAALLEEQNQALAKEYRSDVWAHCVPLPEVGGLLCRLPVEVELQRNYEHSFWGKALRKSSKVTAATAAKENITFLYRKAHFLISETIDKIRETAKNGMVDPTKLSEELREMLGMYIDNQETWQEVCLVLSHGADSIFGSTSSTESSPSSTTLVINRPMAFQLTENLAELILYGRPSSSSSSSSSSFKIPRQLQPRSSISDFLQAFGSECGVYVGGPDQQDQPAVLLHPFVDLEGAVEVSPGTNIYRGGLDAAIQGVLDGKYQPLDFRFFIGRHEYTQSAALEAEVVLGKWQPVAAARTVSLKQCIALPKPLWHEVMELCGGDMEIVSKLELEKRHDLQQGRGAGRPKAISDEELHEKIQGALEAGELVDGLEELFSDEDEEGDE